MPIIDKKELECLRARSSRLQAEEAESHGLTASLLLTMELTNRLQNGFGRNPAAKKLRTFLTPHDSTACTKAGTLCTRERTLATFSRLFLFCLLEIDPHRSTTNELKRTTAPKASSKKDRMKHLKGRGERNAETQARRGAKALKAVQTCGILFDKFVPNKISDDVVK